MVLAALPVVALPVQVFAQTNAPAPSNTSPSNTILAQQATAAMQRGAWAEALPLWQVLLARLQAAGRGDAPPGLMAARGVAGCLLELGRAAEALPLLERVLAVQEAQPGGANADDSMPTILGVAVARDATGDAAAGNAMITRYITHYRAKSQPNAAERFALSTGLFQQARMAQRQALAGATAQWDVAIAAMVEAIPLAAAAQPNPQAEASQTYLLSDMYLQANRVPEAIGAAEAAIPLMTTAFGPTHEMTVQAYENVGTIRIYRTDEEEPGIAPTEHACAAWRAMGAVKRTELRRCLNTLADGYNYVDRDVEEVPLRQEILTMARADDGAGSDPAMVAADRLVEALVQIDRHAEAQSVVETTLALPQVRALPAARHVGLLRRLANSAISRADYPLARRSFAAIMAALDGNGERQVERAMAEGMIGFIAVQSNDVAEADALFERSLPLLRGQKGREVRDTLALLEPMAAIARVRNGRGAGDPALITAAAAREAVTAGGDSGEDSFAVAFAALSAGDYVRAEAGFGRTRTALERHYPRATRTPAMTGLLGFTRALRGYAMVAMHRNAEAELLFKSALAEMSSLTSGAALQYRASAAYGLGDLLWQIDRDAEAVPYLRQAIAWGEASEVADDLFLQMARTRLASAIRFATPQSREPLAVLDGSVADVRQARMRAALGSDAGADAGDQALARATAGDRSFNDPLRDVFRLYLTEAARAPYRPQAATAPYQDAVFAAAQDLAASHAGSTMRATAARLSLGSGAAGELLREQARLAEQAGGIEARLAAARNGSDPAAVTALAAERSALAVRLAAIDAQIDRVAPHYRLLIAPRAIDLTAFRARLRPDEALVLVAGAAAPDAAPNSTGVESLFVVTVSATDFAWHEVADARAANALIDRMRCSMDPAACRPDDALDGTLPPFDAEAAWQVWHRLIEPVERPLANARRIFVTASGRLGELPFAALVTAAPQGGGGQVSEETQWFGDRASFIVLPSVAALRAIPHDRRADERRPRYVAYGAPDLVPTAASEHGAMPRGLADPARLRASFAPLAGAGREMREVALAMGADAGTIHIDSAATETAIRADARIGTAQIVHFATHGLLPDPTASAPILSEPGLVFTPPAMPTMADDGVLSASEVSDMRLSADWLILSACTTATAGGKDAAIGDPDSLGVLARAFLFAGARRLVASHWNLSSVTGRLIVTQTLKAVAVDPTLRPSVALAQTQRALRTGHNADGSDVFGWDRSWRHPFFWAPLSIIAYDDEP